MRLYKRKDFIKLPQKTIYSRVDKKNGGELMHGLFCKTSTEQEYNDDFVEQDLISEAGFPLSPSNRDGMDNIEHQMHLRDTFQKFRTDLKCSGRDGMFEDEDLFVVWDNVDVMKLISYLLNTIDK